MIITKIKMMMMIMMIYHLASIPVPGTAVLSPSTGEREGGQKVLLQHDPHPVLGVLQPGDSSQLAVSDQTVVLVGIAGSTSPECTEICTVQPSHRLVCSKDGALPGRQTDIPGTLCG